MKQAELWSSCLKSFTLLCLLVTFTNALPVYFKDCGSKEGKITSVSVSGCKDTDDTCFLKKGTTVNVTVGFTSSEEITKATAVVHGILASIPIPFPIPQTDGCKSGLNCPVKQGTAVTYKAGIPVSTSFPLLKVVVKWELKDQNSVDIFCALFKSEIVN